jgi:uncharacterized Zn-finger protein
MMLARTYLPLDSVSCCPHCGTVLGTDSEEDVTLHLVDPGWLSVSSGEYGLRPPLPPRSLSADSTEATCPYCGGKVELSTIVHRDPDEFITIEM